MFFVMIYPVCGNEAGKNSANIEDTGLSLHSSRFIIMQENIKVLSKYARKVAKMMKNSLNNLFFTDFWVDYRNLELYIVQCS
jgi:hypothetical protein